MRGGRASVRPMWQAGPLPEDDGALVRALQHANLPTLLMVMVQLTGDRALMRGAIRPRRATPQRPGGGLDQAQAQAIRAQALQLLRELREGRRVLPPPPEPSLLHEMMRFSLGQEVPAEYVPMMMQDLGWQPAAAIEPLPAARARDFHVLVIGAGMSGILAALQLQQLGVRYTVIEKNPEVGGTWHENRYPGCRVDLPSHFYCYSFAPNPDWSACFAPQDELAAYFRGIAERSGVREAIRFGSEVRQARWEPDAACWQVTLRGPDGREQQMRAHAIVSAVGQLNRPAIPAIAGLSDFGGPVFHTAAWQRDVALSGKRVGVIGTGASAMQVVPRIAPEVERLSIFQRSPQWAVPNPDYLRAIDEGEKWLLRHVPYYAAFYRLRLFYVYGDGVHESLQVDPAWPHPERALNAANDRVREQLTAYIEHELGARRDLLPKALPGYPPFAKRMLLDNHWFRTLTRDNVELVTGAIERVVPGAVVTGDGSRRELDVLVLATGFQANRFLWPMLLRGSSGELLSERWGDDPRAYLGITVPGFPNLFMLYGPNTNLAHGGSIIFHSECQMRYIRGCLELLLRGGHAAMDCKQAVHDAYNARVDALHARMVWTHPQVSNWYRNARGRVTTNSPFRLVDYWELTSEVSPADYVLT